MKKIFMFFVLGVIFIMCVGCVNLNDNSTNEDVPTTNSKENEDEYTGMKLEKKIFNKDEIINVYVKGYNPKYLIGLYDEEMYEPGRQDLFSDPTPHFIEKNIKRDCILYEFDSSYFNKAGEYYLYLYNGMNYQVEQKEVIRIWDEDSVDYKIKSASFNVVNMIPYIKILPSSNAVNKELTYRIYWTSDNERLNDYTILKQINYTGVEEFTVALNQNLIMPDEADGIEISVFDGLSTSYFLSVDNILKIKKSKYLYSFQAISDLHIEGFTWQPYFAAHLVEAFKDIKNLSLDTSGIFVVGDITNKGTESQYSVYYEILNQTFSSNKPNIYYALGNHEYFHGTYSTNEFQSAIDLYLNQTKMDSIYYSLEINSNKFIVLGSESSVGEGTMSQNQIDWFKKELEQTNRNEPVYVFMHQSIYNTISGSLPGQNWHGFVNEGSKLREILNDYPNVIVFSGHSHWQLDSELPVLLGNGNGANYVNCASVGYLWNDNNTNEMGSEGIFVEVYEDYILIKGREFTEHKWVASTQIVIYLH